MSQFHQRGAEVVFAIFLCSIVLALIWGAIELIMWLGQWNVQPVEPWGGPL